MNTELRDQALLQHGDDLVKMIVMAPTSLAGLFDLCQRMPDHRGMYHAAVRALEVGWISPNGYGQLVLTNTGRVRYAEVTRPKHVTDQEMLADIGAALHRAMELADEA